MKKRLFFKLISTSKNLFKICPKLFEWKQVDTCIYETLPKAWMCESLLLNYALNYLKTQKIAKDGARKQGRS